jgi:SAM-dependent methyltransferase
VLERTRLNLRSDLFRRAATAHRRIRATRSPNGTGPTCLVCGAERPDFGTFAFESKPNLVREMAKCPRCGYVQIKELPVDRYRGKKNIDELPSGGSRIGTEDTPGREFMMARMALDILGRDDVEVMVYGIGRSLDNHHIAALPRVRNVAIGDIMKVRDDAEFHDANQPASKKFDVVIASEVIEHFRTPHEDFAKLFQFVARDGLLVCGTNVHAGGDLTRDRYPYWPDHTSYYTAPALLEVARRNGYYLDFRTPRMAADGGRKRYVMFTKSPRVQQAIALYFAGRANAPSE